MPKAVIEGVNKLGEEEEKVERIKLLLLNSQELRTIYIN